MLKIAKANEWYVSLPKWENCKDCADAAKKYGYISTVQIILTRKYNSEYSIEAMKKSLEDLQLEYLDLYLMHWPLAFKKEQAQSAEDLYSLDEVPLVKTFNAMVELKEKGLVKHVGVSNFSIKKFTGHQ